MRLCPCLAGKGVRGFESPVLHPTIRPAVGNVDRVARMATEVGMTRPSLSRVLREQSRLRRIKAPHYRGSRGVRRASTVQLPIAGGRVDLTWCRDMLVHAEKALAWATVIRVTHQAERCPLRGSASERSCASRRAPCPALTAPRPAPA